MSGVRCSHHVLRVKRLLRELRNGHGTVLLAATGRQRSKIGHEEIQTREGNYHHINIH